MFITMMFGFVIVYHPACRMRGSPAVSVASRRFAIAC
jgi:hypothetical protein